MSETEQHRQQPLRRVGDMKHSEERIELNKPFPAVREVRGKSRNRRDECLALGRSPARDTTVPDQETVPSLGKHPWVSVTEK